MDVGDSFSATQSGHPLDLESPVEGHHNISKSLTKYDES
jgi:hypothetical protein